MRLPRFDATTAPTGTGLVRADPRAQTDVGDAQFRGLQALGAGLQGAGGSLGKIAQHKQKISDDTQTDRISQNMQIWASEQGAAMKEMRIETPDDQKKILGEPGKVSSGELWKSYNKMLEQELKGTSRGVQRNVRSLSSRMFPTIHDNARKITSAKFVDYTKTTEFEMARAEAREGDLEASNERIGRLLEKGVIVDSEATKERTANAIIAVESEVIGLYRAGFHDEARKVLEASSLSAKEKEKLDDEIDQDKNRADVQFENEINQSLVDIDNTEDLTQREFNEAAKVAKDKILVADIDGTKRKQMLVGLEKWRRGTNETDYAKVLSLNQEMDAAQRSGIVDPTIENRITQANLDGSFGGRHKGGNKIYGDMIRRFEKLKFDERIQATSFIVKTFERENADDPRLIFLFHQAKNKLITDMPDADTKELFIKISGLAEAYSVLPEVVIENKLRSKTVRMTSPDGEPFNVPIEKRQLFIDNGYTE